MSAVLAILGVTVALPLSRMAAAAPSPASEALNLRGNRLFLPVTVNGVTTEAILDSAAEMTFIDEKFARRVGLVSHGDDIARGSGGEQKTRFAEGVTLRAAGVTLAKRTVAVLDLDELSSRLVGEPIRVIVGRELFDAARLEIDIEKGTIRRLSRTTDPSGIRLALGSHAGIENVPVIVEGAAARADLDLGNGSEVLIGKIFADSHALSQPQRIIERKSGGGIGGAINRDVILLSRLEIGGRTFENVRAAIDPLDTAGEVNVGVDILRNFVLVTDFAQHRVWLRGR